MYIQSSQPSPLHYLLDARHGTSEGFFSNTNVGSLWSRMYLDSKEVPILWSVLPKDTWTHVHLESTTPFSDDVNFMSRFTLNAATSYPYQMGCLHGSLAEVYFWDRVLTLYEVTCLVQPISSPRDGLVRQHAYAHITPRVRPRP